MINNIDVANEFVWPVRVYYEDTDAGGVVYYANYLKFLERARTECLRHLGYEQDLLRQSYRLLFVVRSVNVEYLRPARFNEALCVSAKVAEVKRASMLFEQRITRKGESEPLLVATIRIASLDEQSFRPKSIPNEMRAEIVNGN